MHSPAVHGRSSQLCLSCVGLSCWQARKAKACQAQIRRRPLLQRKEDEDRPPCPAGPVARDRSMGPRRLAARQRRETGRRRVSGVRRPEAAPSYSRPCRSGQVEGALPLADGEKHALAQHLQAAVRRQLDVVGAPAGSNFLHFICCSNTRRARRSRQHIGWCRNITRHGALAVMTDDSDASGALKAIGMRQPQRSAAYQRPLHVGSQT